MFNSFLVQYINNINISHTGGNFGILLNLKLEYFCEHSLNHIVYITAYASLPSHQSSTGVFINLLNKILSPLYVISIIKLVVNG